MKLGFNFEKKNATLEVDAEKLIEKGMEQHERNWKDKFTFKHSAKKEIMDLKHKNKIEVEDKKEKRKTRYQIKQEEKRKNKELELRKLLIGFGVMIGFMILIPLLVGIVGFIFK